MISIFNIILASFLLFPLKMIYSRRINIPKNPKTTTTTINKNKVSREKYDDECIITTIKPSSSENITNIAIYSGMMKMIYNNMINTNEILLTLQDTLYTEMDCNCHSIPENDLFTLILFNALILNYQQHKIKEVNVIKDLYNEPNSNTKLNPNPNPNPNSKTNTNAKLKYNIIDISDYFNTKRISSKIFFILYTIICRNIHNAE